MEKAELKNLVDRMCAKIVKMQEQVNLIKARGKEMKIFTDQEQVFNNARAEFALFMMFLSASDGKVAQEEAQIIYDVCGMGFSPEHLERFIAEQDIYSEDFATTPPTLFKLVVSMDEMLIKSGMMQEPYERFSDELIETYRLVGKALMESDGKATEGEEQDYTRYIRMLRKYQKDVLG